MPIQPHTPFHPCHTNPSNCTTHTLPPIRLDGCCPPHLRHVVGQGLYPLAPEWVAPQVQAHEVSHAGQYRSQLAGTQVTHAAAPQVEAGQAGCVAEVGCQGRGT